MKTNTKHTYLDYKTIQQESHCVDCTISEADFYTNRPNLYRINAIVCDLNKHLKITTGGRL